MQIERRITFIIGSEGFASWKLNRLNTLSGYFRSVVILKNITTGESCNVENTLKVLSLGSKKNHLCQLWIEGSDAELACMILTDFIDSEFEIVNTSHRRASEQSQSVIDNHQSFKLPFPLTYSQDELRSDALQGKYALLSKMSTMLNDKIAQITFEAMLKREEISSTCLGHHIALPHVMLTDTKQAAIAVVKSELPINWHSARGEVTTVIAMLIPSPAPMPLLKAFTQLSKALLDPEFCSLIISTKEPEALKAILLHKMAQTRV